MNNILVSLKKFITNKNVVTVIGVIAILGLLYWGYNSVIQSQVKPIRIPVAKTTIQPRTLITDDMITYIEIPSAAVSKNVIRTSQAIINAELYTAINTVIPAGSMFYQDVLVTKENLPDYAFSEVKEGNRPYALSVTTASTYGNSIRPGNIVDIYMKAINENGQVMIGRLIETATVLAVKDNAGNNVFEDATAKRTPSTLLFGVEDEIYMLLKASEYLRSYGVELFPVPYGGVPPVGDLTVDKQQLVDFIESKAELLKDVVEEEPSEEAGNE